MGGKESKDSAHRFTTVTNLEKLSYVSLTTASPRNKKEADKDEASGTIKSY